MLQCKLLIYEPAKSRNNHKKVQKNNSWCKRQVSYGQKKISMQLIYTYFFIEPMYLYSLFTPKNYIMTTITTIKANIKY